MEVTVIHTFCMGVTLQLYPSSHFIYQVYNHLSVCVYVCMCACKYRNKYVYIHLSVYLTACLSTNLNAKLSIYPSTYILIYPDTNLRNFLITYPPTQLPIYLPHLPTYLPIYQLLIYASIYLGTSEIDTTNNPAYESITGYRQNGKYNQIYSKV